MKRYVSALPLVIMLAAVLSGCYVIFEHPFIPEKDCRPDDRLVGTWMLEGREKSSPIFIIVKTGKGLLLKNNDFSMGPGGDAVKSCFRDGVSVLMIQDNKGMDDQSFMGFAYEFKSDNYTLYPFSMEAIKTVCQSGKLKCTLESTGDIRISSPAEETAKIIDAIGIKSLINWTEPIPMVRADGP